MDNSVLSYIDNSIEIMQNHWNNIGDDSTIEIFDDFTHANIKIESSSINHKQATTMKGLQVTLTNGGQSFLQKLKTTTQKSFINQSDATEENSQQCQKTSFFNSQYTKANPAELPFQRQDKSYFNQSIKFQTTNSNINITTQPTQTYGFSTNSSNMQQTPGTIKFIGSGRINKEVMFSQETLSNKQISILNSQSSSGMIQLPFFRRIKQSEESPQNTYGLKSAFQKEDNQSKLKRTLSQSQAECGSLLTKALSEKCGSRKVELVIKKSKINIKKQPPCNQNIPLLKVKVIKQVDPSKKSPPKLKFKNSQKSSNKENSSISSNQIQQNKQSQSMMTHFLEEEENMRKQMEKDIKCIQKFSEQTIISPNAIFYRSKSTQPIHRKSYSFNSPHFMGSFLRKFNQSLKSRQQHENFNDSSMCNEPESSFLNLEDKSFLIDNRYAN